MKREGVGLSEHKKFDYVSKMNFTKANKRVLCVRTGHVYSPKCAIAGESKIGLRCAIIVTTHQKMPCTTV